MDRLPERYRGTLGEGLKTVLISKDSALFQALNRAVQYGDFIAKAVLYDHLVERKGMDHQQAIDRIAEEFVAFNRLGGRGREFLEATGLLWFWNYKIRIGKVALNTLRERPFSALLAMNGGAAAGVDTPFSASLPGAMWGGRLGYSMGPGMGLDSWKLHPVAGLAGY